MRALVAFLLFHLVLLQGNSFAQEAEGDSLLKKVEDTYGIEKLKAINEVSKHYLPTDERIKFKYSKKGVDLAENLLEGSADSIYSEKSPFIEAFYLAARIDFDKALFFNAKLNFQQALALNEAFQITLYREESQLYLDSIQGMIDRGEIKEGKLLNKLNRLKVGKLIKDVSLDAAIKSEIKIGKAKEDLGNETAAIGHYKEAINLCRNKGDYTTINQLQLKIAELLQQLNQEVEAQQFLEEAIEEREAEVVPVEVNDSLAVSLNELKEMADSLADSKNYGQSELYYQLYHELSKRMVRDSIQADLLAEQKHKEILLLKQQKEIADLNVQSSIREKEKEQSQKRAIFIIACLILIASIFIYYFYWAKRKEHQKLNETYTALKKTKNELEEAEQKIVTLLKQQVSQDIADKLLVDQSDKKAERHFVCILFLDIRNFTKRAEQLSPEELIAFQNKAFGFMIDCVERHHGNINQLLGDGFMASFGAPVSHGNDCQNAYNASRSILKELKQQIEQEQLPDFRIGIGLHAGYIVSGNVGNKNRMQYSITGNPVIIASRIEQLNKTFASQFILSEAVYHELEAETKESLPAVFEEVSLKGRTQPIKVMVVEK